MAEGGPEPELTHAVLAPHPPGRAGAWVPAQPRAGCARTWGLCSESTINLQAEKKLIRFPRQPGAVSCLPMGGR